MNPTHYRRDIADLILDRVAAGESLRAVCRTPGLPAENVVRRWAIDDHDRFSARFERACAVRCYALADEILTISDAARDSDSAAAARVQTENRRWLLSRLLPRVFGDRLAVDSTVTISVASELATARARAALLVATPIIEALPALSEPAQ